MRKEIKRTAPADITIQVLRQDNKKKKECFFFWGATWFSYVFCRRRWLTSQAEPQPEPPEWGTVAGGSVGHRDTRFPVGTFAPGGPKKPGSTAGSFGRRRPAARVGVGRRVELVSCTGPADDRVWRAIMPALGFTCVEQTLGLSFRIQTYTAEHSASGAATRPPTTTRRSGIPARLSATGATTRDRAFPPELADRRYRRVTGSTSPAPRRTRRTASTWWARPAM